MALSLKAPLAALVLVLGVLLWRVSTDPVVPERAAASPTYSSFRVKTASGTLGLEDLRGQAVVVYFGYTACPDICPTTLATVGAAIRKLPSAQAARATALFVSVDPERDAVDRIDDYVRYFHPRFLAGHAEEPRLTELAADWGVYFRRQATDSALAYAVDHSTQAFLLNPEGRMVRQLPHGMRATEMAVALADVLGETLAP